MTEPSTWGALHAGDTIVGADGEAWGVLGTLSEPFAIALYRLGRTVIGYPDPSGPVSVIRRADTDTEARAWGVLSGAGFAPEVIRESWEVEQ